jgi:hypothetical protein
MSTKKVAPFEKVDLFVSGKVITTRRILHPKDGWCQTQMHANIDRHFLDEILGVSNFHRVAWQDARVTDVQIVIEHPTYESNDSGGLSSIDIVREILVYRTDGYNSYKHTSNEVCVDIVQGLLDKHPDIEYALESGYYLCNHEARAGSVPGSCQCCRVKQEG